MAHRRYIDQSQPQTLQGAVIFCYLNAALSLLFALIERGTALYYLPIILLAGAAYGIANERKWGYWGAVGLSVVNLGVVLYALATGGGFGGIFTLAFAVLLVALLLHRESRSYVGIWFRWHG